ncbi:hypothetical protein [Streptomyces sp. NPDC058466]
MTAPVRDDLPFDDLADFENADRGFIVALVPGVIRVCTKSWGSVSRT